MRNPTRISIFSTLPRLPIAMAKSFAWGTCRPVLMSCEQPILTYTLLAQRRCTSPHASFLLLACISGSSWPILTIASTLTQHQPVFCAPAAPRRPLPSTSGFHITNPRRACSSCQPDYVSRFRPALSCDLPGCAPLLRRCIPAVYIHHHTSANHTYANHQLPVRRTVADFAFLIFLIILRCIASLCTR
jgi:hypothetical protein